MKNNLVAVTKISKIMLTFGCASLALAGCVSHNATSQVTKTTTPSFAHSGITTITGIAYGQDERQRLDIYSPADNQPHPVLIFAYGGSWQHGSRQQYAFIGRQFAKAGYTTVVMDYRLAPKNIYPAYVEDTAQAIGWVYHHITAYRGNAEQLFVMGHSAGAFNVVAAVDDARYWQRATVPDKAVLGVIGLAGPYDYDFRSGQTQIAFPKGSTPTEVMPVNHIRSGVPPHLLLIGDKDTTVYPQNANSLQNALVRAGGQVERAHVPASHVGIIIGLTQPLQPFYPTYHVILDYLKRHTPPNRQ